MNKRIISIMIVLLMCLSLFPLSAAAASSLTATYADGVVTVVGTGFASGTSYTVRVVDTANSSIKAMEQTEADGSGNISASIITSVLETWANYTVYIKPDGTLAGSFTYSGGGGGGGGGSVTPTSTPIPESEITIVVDGNTTYITINVKAAFDPATGTTTAKVEESTFITLINKVKEAEASGQKVVVIIKVEASTGTSAVVVEIPRSAFNKLVMETKAALKFDAGIGTITFREKTIESINGEVNTGNIFISITRIKTSALTPEVLAKVGDRPVYEFSVKAGSTQISKFIGGNAEISIPYTIKTDEKKNSVIVYYIDNTGKLKTVRGKYVPATGTVNFKTTHLSMFAVGYNEVNFNDVAANACYNEGMYVLQIEDGMEIKPDCVYVIPSGKFLRIYPMNCELL